MVKPKISEVVRKLKISETVDVEIIVDTYGDAIYAKAINKHRALRYFAVKAACKSKFSPKIICDKKI